MLSGIKRLEKSLLPNPKLNGNYTKKESDLIRSYVLLCHAEIESYFEDIAELKVKKALSSWRNNRKKSNCLLAIMAFTADEMNFAKIKKDDKEKLGYRVSLVADHFLKKLKNNHGIKSENILSMLLPIGFEREEFDQTWLNAMNAFGSKRGKFAHKASRVQDQIDLVTEKNEINNSILPEIERIDLYLKTLK